MKEFLNEKGLWQEVTPDVVEKANRFLNSEYYYKQTNPPTNSLRGKSCTKVTLEDNLPEEIQEEWGDSIALLFHLQ